MSVFLRQQLRQRRAFFVSIALAVVTAVLVSFAPCTLAAGAGETAPSAAEGGVEYLVPEMADRGFSIEDGKRSFERRLGFSPGAGQLGNQPYYTLRLSFNPRPWLGWEAQIGHNPSESVHALVHGLSVQLRWPLPWRAQPYATFGYGMMMIFPGRVFEADPVTKNQFAAGLGLELYLREDVALRGEMRGTTILGRDADTETSRSYGYQEFTVGLTFYRTLAP